MSTWIKENKGLAATCGLGLLVSIAAFLVGFHYNGEQSKIEGQFLQAKEQIDAAASAQVVPTPGNLEQKKGQVELYTDSLGELQAFFEKFSPGPIDKSITPNAFSEKLRLSRDKVQAEFAKASVQLPAQFNKGFEIYASRPPLQAATGMLDYQLGAIGWVLNTIKNAGTIELVNMVREPSDVEKPEGSEKPEPGKGAKTSVKVSAGGREFLSMPLQICLRGDRKSAAKILNELTSSNKYFARILAVRIKNSKDKSPLKSDAKFEDAIEQTLPEVPSVSPSEGGMVLQEGGGDQGQQLPQPTAPVAVPPGSAILKQVLGNETVDLYLVLEIILPLEKQAEGKTPGRKAESASSNKSDTPKN